MPALVYLITSQKSQNRLLSFLHYNFNYVIPKKNFKENESQSFYSVNIHFGFSWREGPIYEVYWIEPIL